MRKTAVKWFLRILPLMYMDFIWYQSEHFQPESVMHLSRYTLVSLGILFEAAHLFEFGLLYAALVVAMLTFGSFTRRKEMIALIIALGYAGLDELHQYYVPFRSASVSDLVKDVIGIAVIWWFIRRSYRSERSHIGHWLKKCENSFAKE